MTPVTAPAHGPSTPRGHSTAPMRRAVLGALLALAAALSVSLTSVAPAQATITRLCYGFSDCLDKGYGNGGYRKHIGTMWWRMYSGHNCTNYAAYRMIQSGMSTTRPWDGSGNASNWGYAMDHITDQTPSVGAVAWWKAYAPGAGSSGHVAIVEQVISEDKIIVSQDSWGGDFSWAVITRSGSGWPSGFIHFNDRDMQVVAAPSVVGEPRVGATLSTDGGSWQPGDPSLAYQWKVGRKAIAGATAPTYTVRREDRDKRVRVRVIASKAGYPSMKALSARTAPVAPGELAATAAPTVTGTPTVDQPLTATAGAWNVAPDSVRYQWLSAGQPIAGATAATFTPRAAHVDTRIRVVVTAVKEGYDDVDASSVATVPVAPGALTAVRAPALTGLPQPGQTLTLDAGEVSPQAPAAVQWLRDGEPVDGATSPTYAVTVDDLGSVLSATVTRERAGYTPLTVTSPAIAPVLSPTTVTARSRTPEAGVVRVLGSVISPDLAPVTGSVVVKKRRKVLGTAELVDGRLDLVVEGLRAGEKRFVVLHPGSDLTTRSRTRILVTVR